MSVLSQYKVAPPNNDDAAIIKSFINNIMFFKFHQRRSARLVPL